MTSISAAANSTSYSPLQRLQQELQSEVSGGTVSASDQTALSAALVDIDSSLKSDASASQSASSGPTSPGDIQTKINDLILKEVSGGKLTSDQAKELQNIFSKAFADGSGGQNGTQGAGSLPLAPPPGPPPVGTASSQPDAGFSIADLLSSSDAPSASSASSKDETTSTDGSSAKTADVNNILKDFLKLLQDSQSSGATYGSSSSASTSLSALLVNYQT